MNIVMLDAATLGNDIDFECIRSLGALTVHNMTPAEKVCDNIKDAEVIIVNKVKLNEGNLSCAKNLKLICITATGFDNIDLDYCREHSIAVCNVKGYSTDSVAQLTVALVLSLVMHLGVSDKYVKDGSYTKSGVQNCLTPVFHEINGMTWGVVGMGNIGRKTAQIAETMGAHVIAYNRTRRDDFEYTDLDDLCKRADIISIHLPLNADTEKLIDKEHISLMKKTAVVVNVARGAVVDEESLTNAVINGDIGAIGIDVYSTEPLSSDSPYNRLLDYDNVIFTPHMAWGTFEARNRCISEVGKNIDAFFNSNEKRNRIV